MKCQRLWLYLGVISGFLSGFLYFAYGVYTHGNTRGARPYENTQFMNTQFMQLGATIPRSYE